MEQPPVVHSADVLVIGGGFAGTWAALRAAELSVAVLLVDKGYVSRSGASTMSGGVTTAPMPDDDLDQWVEELARLGGYETDQDWARQLCRDQMHRVRTLDAWGVPIVRNEDGSIKRISSRGMVVIRAMQYSPRVAMEQLRAHVEKAGVRIVDKVMLVDLLTSDGRYPTGGRVIGAYGFDVLTGRVHVVTAKSVIVASGPVNIKGTRPIDNDTGDGAAMGYRVGARFVDMEFSASGTFEMLYKRFRFNNYNIAVGNGARLINRRGERFMEKYDPQRLERTELNRVVAAFMKELIDGRGPVYVDLTGCGPEYWEALNRVGRPGALTAGLVPDPKVRPAPVEASWTMWNGGKGGMQVNLRCQTSVPGLYAAGGASRNAGVGRHGSAGTPTAYAMVSGYRAGEAAATEALAREAYSLADARIAALASMIGPRERPAGEAVSASDLYTMSARVPGSSLDLMILNQDRITAALDRIERVREAAARVRVADTQDLVRYHESVNTLDWLELVMSCMLDRTESRESFYREDHPYTDDGEWLCWHTGTRISSGIEFDRQRIPFERYPFAPPRRERFLSPVAAIFRGEYHAARYGVH